MRWKVETTGAELKKHLKDIQKPIAKIATATIKEAAQLVKKNAAIEIQSAGFSSRSSKTLKYTLDPERGESIDISATFKFRRGFFSVFEEGATIQGKPLLWLPLETVPFGRGNKRLTPKEYSARIGPLAKTKGTNPPYLVGKTSRAGVLRATTSNLTLRKRGRRAIKTAPLLSQNVPLYVGVPSVTIPKKFDVKGVIQDVAKQIPEIYLKNAKEEIDSVNG
jgi:hypothetical protein